MHTCSKNARIMLLSKYAICISKKSRFKKKEEAKGFLRKICLKTPLSKIPLLDYILFNLDLI